MSNIVGRSTAGCADGGTALEELMEALMEAIAWGAGAMKATVWGAGVKIQSKLGLVLGCRHDDVCLGWCHCTHSPSRANTRKEI